MDRSRASSSSFDFPRSGASSDDRSRQASFNLPQQWRPHAARGDDALPGPDERRRLADDGPARAERPRALREQPGQRTPSGRAANVQLRPLEL